MKFLTQAATVALMVSALALPASAQQYANVSQTDIQRLQDNVLQASTDVSQLRGRDSARANQLQAELDDLRDEVVYLKVKLRKDPQGMARSEYTDVRDRIEDLRTRARGDSLNAYTPAPANRGTQSTPRGTTGTGSSATGTTSARGALEIPAGTEMDVRLSNTLNSGTAKVEDRFEGTTLVDVNVNGRTAVPAGSVVRGVITAVEPATRTNRTAKMTVSFDQITVNGRAYPLRGTVTQAIEGEGIKGEAARIGTGAGVGAIIGGILGGFKGALAGILIGGGGTIAATEGKEVELPQGSVLRVRVDAPLTITNAR
jgi:TolA-binding protein